MSFVNSTWFTRKNMRKWRWIRRKCRSLCNSCNLRHWTVERYRQVKCRCKFVWSCTVRCELCTEKYSFTTCGWKWWTTCSFWNLNIALYWKLDRECHVDFCMFLSPPRIELWTLDENSKKENEKECVKAVLYIVILEYSLYSKLSCCIRFIHAACSWFSLLLLVCSWTQAKYQTVNLLHWYVNCIAIDRSIGECC